MNGVEKTLMARWNGATWYFETMTGGSKFLDVSCVGTTACTAVGNAGGSAFIQAWNGSEWKTQTVASPAGLVLDGVSCTAANACTAVSETSPANTLVVQRWDGTSWKAQTTATLTGATSVKGLEVSCSTATHCIAVGSYVNSSGVGVPLIERWNGTTWQVQTTATPAGSTNPVLSGVKCFNPSLCLAVGGNDTGVGKGETLSTWAF